MRSGWILP